MLTSRTSIALPGTLDPNRGRDALVGLHPDHQRVLAEFLGHRRVERQVRSALEHQRDLGHPAAQAFSGAQVERHACPAPGVDLQRDRRERLGRRVLGEALLLEQPDAPSRCPASRRCTARERWSRPAVASSRVAESTLIFSACSSCGLKLTGSSIAVSASSCIRWFWMTSRAAPDPVVVAAAAAEADVLGHRDLDVVDVVGVPDRLVQLVGEAQRQDVLHRLLAEVVVDAEHRLLGEDAVDHVVELLCAVQVVAERLLDDHAAPPVACCGPGQPGLRQLLAHRRERLRRNRQVEGVIAAGAALGVELLQRLGQPLETPSRRRRCPGRSGFPRPAGPRPPGGTACGRAPCTASQHDLGEVLVGPSPAGRTRPARTLAAAARGWPGRRSRASASWWPDRR